MPIESLPKISSPLSLVSRDHSMMPMVRYVSLMMQNKFELAARPSIVEEEIRIARGIVERARTATMTNFILMDSLRRCPDRVGKKIVWKI